jgi:tetratricopeptide (TPR) repeat protein
MTKAAERVAAQWPDSPKSLWCLIGAMHMRLHVLSMCGRSAEVEGLRARIIELGRELVDRAPTERMYATHHIFSLAGAAEVELHAGDAGAAEVLLAEARPLLERALVLDGHERTAHDAGVAYYTRLARAQVARGASDLARGSMERALHHARESAKVDPTSAEAAFGALRVGTLWVSFLSEYGPDDGALEAACVLRESMLDVIERYPLHREPCDMLARFSMDPPHPGARDLPLALAAARRAVELADPDSPEPFELLAAVLELQGDPTGASDALRRAVRVMEAREARVQEAIRAKLAQLAATEPAAPAPSRRP